MSRRLIALGALVILLLPAAFSGSALAITNQQNSATTTGASSGANLASGAVTTAATTTSASNWLTYHDFSNKSGFTTSIPAINSPSVNWTQQVGGSVYAEPLVYNGMTYIAAENDVVYALSSSTGAIAWSVTLGTPAKSDTVPYACDGEQPSITPQIGITGTPVIDPTTSTLYVVALNSGVGFTLFAINTTTGQIRWSSTVTTSGFNFTPEEQRGALALANGMVYIPFGSYSWACAPAFGWLFAISANGNGTQYSHQVDTQSEGDIWEAEGVTVDSSGSIYVVTGNSYYNATYNYADSVLKFTPKLQLVSYFAPSNWAYIGPADYDQDTTGATLLPGNLIFSIGKEGIGYLVSSTNLGGIGGQVYSAPVCKSPAQGWPYGAWGSTSYYNGIIYVPCNTGLAAITLHGGAEPTFTGLWNYTGIDAGPAIVAGGAVWAVSIATKPDLYAFNPQTGAVLFQMALAVTDDHFVTPAAGDGLVFMADNETIYAISPSSVTSSGTSSLTVTSQNTSGQTIKGYETVLYSSSKTVIATGFTPATYTVTDGQSYIIQADSYGSCNFDYWSNTDGTSNQQSISISSNTQITAVYNCGTTPTTSTAAVSSVNQNGAAITGYEAVLYSSSGSVLAQGTTPYTFTTTVGQTYGLGAENSGSCTFTKWSDGVTSNPRTFTATSSAVTFTADYNCVSTTSTVTVDSVNQNGAAITGFYTVLYSSTGSIITTGFTPTTFTTTVGDTYGVRAESYGSCTFSKWSDGVTSDPRTFTATSSGITYTADYNCSTSTPTTSTLTVTTVNSAGTTIKGYYVTLWQNGEMVSSCFSTCSFTVNDGQTYQVQAASYGAETFSHWQNDGATGRETVNVPSTSTTIQLTAVYSP